MTTRPQPPRSGTTPRLPAPRPPGKETSRHALAIHAEGEVSLRLAIGRAGVGIELARPTQLECLVVTELTAVLPNARFPLDVSGGVARFRHRRGTLRTLQLEVRARSLERWAGARLRGAIGSRAPDVWLGARAAGATVCVATPVDEPSGTRGGVPIVTFDVDAMSENGDLVFLVKRARGVDLPAPPTAMAIACTEAMLKGIAARRGALFVVPRAAAAVGRSLFPRAGARAPAADSMEWTSIATHAGLWILHASHDGLAATPPVEAVRAREAAMLLVEGDDALVAGDMERARNLYLEALERAPRHAEIVRRIVEIDARTSGRAEAALATLAESRTLLRDESLGTTPGELLTEIGDLDAAAASLEHAGETEPSPALAARAFEMAANQARDPEQAARWLDRALVRAPRSTTARWARVERRLEVGRLEDALADVEHLDALARGSAAKHAVWVRAGQAWQAAGMGAKSGALFEQALRHAPDDPDALVGLGAALVGEGRPARGASVIARAIELAEGSARGAQAAPGYHLALARALGEHLDDLPAAIARVQRVASDAAEAPMARGLEGRWRAHLGDLAGASLAFARLRELLGSTPLPAKAASREDALRTTALTALLCEAADLHRTHLRDPLGAQRYLAAALRLLPHDVELRRAYLEIGRVIAGGERESFRPPEGTPSLLAERAESSSAFESPPVAPVPSTAREVAATPGENREHELASLLDALERRHELLALLSARLEDAPPERREELAPRARAALARLAARAESMGRAEEAALYRQAIDTLPE